MKDVEGYNKVVAEYNKNNMNTISKLNHELIVKNLEIKEQDKTIKKQ